MIILTILLTILKWIGIILLGLLGLILLLALIILLVPIRYTVTADSHDKNITAKINVNWIAHFFRFKLDFDLAGHLFKYNLKVAIFEIFGSDKQNSESTRSKSSKKSLFSKNDKPYDTDKNDATQDYAIKDNVKEDKDNSLNSDIDEFDFFNDNTSVKNLSINNDNTADIIKDFNQNEFNENNISGINKPIKSKNKKSITFKQFWINIFNYLKAIPDKLSKIKNKVTNKEYTIIRVCDIIKRKYKIFKKYKDFIDNTISRKAYIFLKSEIKILFKHIGPRKFNLNIEYGFEDLSLTGQMLGVISFLYPKFPGHLNVHPDFEKQCFKADTYIKGHIRLIIVLIHAIKIIKNKEVKLTYKNFISLK